MNNEQELQSVEDYKFEPIKGYPMLNWKGKRPYTSTQYYPAQLKESYGEMKGDWINKIFWGDNLQVMSHLLKEYRGKVKLVYIDPPFDSKAFYKKQIKVKGKNINNDYNSFEEKQYSDMWVNDEFLQFLYERLILIRELLSDDGSIYLHCDYRKVHQIRCIMDEVFGEDNFLNSLVWNFSTRSSIKTSWKRSHHDILFYKKSKNPVYNWDDEMVLEPLSESTIKKYKHEDEIGKYRLNGRFIKDSPIKGAKDVDPKWEKTNPELVVRDYLREGKVASDYFFIDIENQSASTRTDYPTQKPEELLYKLISASSNPGDIVMDCFMGSGTTLAVAMKTGRKFIGADINLGSIQTTTKRLLKVRNEINSNNNIFEIESELFTGFEVYNVNNYDIFRNPVEAKELLIEALEIQPLDGNNVFDGEKDGYMVKILPINRIATKADLNDIIANLDYKTLEIRQRENPNDYVENILLVCMGHEPDLAANLIKEIHYKVNVEVVDILRDKANLEFKRDSEALIKIDNEKLIIQNFYPMNLLQKLSIMKENVTDWKELVESIMIDWNYDGGVLEPTEMDIPSKNDFVKGIYQIPEDAGNIRVKITDLLSESIEVSIENE
ncbi:MULTISPECIES: site-specific DNA-methyltransferase [Bacillus cereus group]|uniref:site-specific DNA-methyltransferase n=1 Tax=Bacillus cereus group TaxID=86661 RepID=UPI00132F14B4|nr:site-specific DNA-methyltransferase [Bacillus cereus group sp. TH254-2LC]MDA1536571.1 site-specific DNA-methyltransferase [Bacillus cereus group sp. TH254-2LC]QHH83672.1 site-specific DNA-methyltransferase [Bacillus paranthracis]